MAAESPIDGPPERGLRLDLRRQTGWSEDEVCYHGTLASSGEQVELVVVVRAGSKYRAEVSGEVDEAVRKMVSSVAATATRSAIVKGRQPPRRIRRWRVQH